MHGSYEQGTVPWLDIKRRDTGVLWNQCAEFFFIGLAAERNLSKLALMKAIQEDVFADTLHAENCTENVEPSCAPVIDSCPDEAVDPPPHQLKRRVSRLWQRVSLPAKGMLCTERMAAASVKSL